MGSIFSPPSPGGTMPPLPDERLRRLQRQRREELRKKNPQRTILTGGFDGRPTIPTARLAPQPTILTAGLAAQTPQPRPTIPPAGLNILPTILTAGLDSRPTIPTAGLNIRPTILTAGLDAQTPQPQPAPPPPAPPQPAQPQPAQPEQPKPEQPKPEQPKPEKPDPKRCEPILDELMQVNRELNVVRAEESDVLGQINDLEIKIERLRDEQDLEGPPSPNRTEPGSGDPRAARLFRRLSPIVHFAGRFNYVTGVPMAIKDGFDAVAAEKRRREIAAARQELVVLKPRLKEIKRVEGEKKFNRGLLERRLADCEKVNGRAGHGP